MKDVDGTLVHTPRNVAVAAPLSPPGLISRVIDAGRRPTYRAAGVAIPYGMLMACDTVVGMHPGGLVQFAAVVGALAAMGRTVWGAGQVVRGQMIEADSIVNRIAGKIPVGQSVAHAVARSIKAEWNRCTIETVHAYGDNNLDDEPRIFQISLPSGASVTVGHRRGRRPIVLLAARQDETDRHIDPKNSLGRIGAATVLDAIVPLQRDRLCGLLGLEPGQAHSTLSRMLAEALPAELKERDETDYVSNFGDLYNREVEYVLETGRIKGAEISVTAIRRKYRTEFLELLVDAPGVGVMSLPPQPFSAVMRRRRKSALEEAFGSGPSEVMTLPLFLGNARATRLGDVARQVLLENPDLVDGSGSPLRALIEEHMPRLLASHRDNTRTARTSDIAEIDATLDRGLDVIARAIGEAIDGIADRKLDALRTEVRFLESRHPETDAILASITLRNAA